MFIYTACSPYEEDATLLADMSDGEFKIAEPTEIAGPTTSDYICVIRSEVPAGEAEELFRDLGLRLHTRSE